MKIFEVWVLELILSCSPWVNVQTGLIFTIQLCKSLYIKYCVVRLWSK